MLLAELATTCHSKRKGRRETSKCRSAMFRLKMLAGDQTLVIQKQKQKEEEEEEGEDVGVVVF